MKKQPDIQFRSPEEIKAFQEAKMAEALGYLSANSEFYRKMFREYSIDVSRIRKIEDLVNIPVTT